MYLFMYRCLYVSMYVCMNVSMQLDESKNAKKILPAPSLNIEGIIDLDPFHSIINDNQLMYL